MSFPIMEALFNGRIIPWERSNADTPERKALEEKIEHEKRHFVEKMSMDDCKRFQDLENLYLQSSFDEQEQIYIHGFTLGALLMMEVMENKEGVINA